MQSLTGEPRPPVPVTCCGAFQAHEGHFVWNAVAGEWGCALKGSEPLPEPDPEPAPAAPAPKTNKPRPRTTRRKS